MEKIKAIETIYNGYRFRSRLEARWAVFFDAAGIKYEYEPEGFRYKSMWEGNEYFYLPDFYLSELKMYVEVKGSKEALIDDFRKIAVSIDWDATPIAECGILILGEIPNYEKICWGNVPMFTYLFRCSNCVGVEHAIFWERCRFDKKKQQLVDCLTIIEGNSNIIDTLYSFEEDYIDSESSDIPDFITTEEMFTKEKLRSRLKHEFLANCFMKARQARFEYGETPTV